ncbi:hypothetical protein GGR43_003578 [Sphingobium jiangsuense]|uniref:Uncharacterized protein n=1 Tax=Sphingobium jiangsuense TaxID=870476 RepID=A0A7W6BIW1_9SPHN|nr:hypothetical protein [Sphingobium jiangsuense]MBB3927841.1 hypothetical protein [Sphingobium jiangsuense]
MSKINPPRDASGKAADFDRQVCALARLWNRSCRQAREDFIEMAQQAKKGLIDI